MENFLRTHGGKLRQLEIMNFPIRILDACSALPVLEWKSSSVRLLNSCDCSYLDSLVLSLLILAILPVMPSIGLWSKSM